MRDKAAHARVKTMSTHPSRLTSDVAWDGRGAHPRVRISSLCSRAESSGVRQNRRGHGKTRWPFDDLEFFFRRPGTKWRRTNIFETWGRSTAPFSRHASVGACAALSSPRFGSLCRREWSAATPPSSSGGLSSSRHPRHPAAPGCAARCARSQGMRRARRRRVVVVIVRAASADAIVSAIAREFASPVGRAQLSGGLTVT